jgi:hypothetical protein
VYRFISFKRFHSSVTKVFREIFANFGLLLRDACSNARMTSPSIFALGLLSPAPAGYGCAMRTSVNKRINSYNELFAQAHKLNAKWSHVTIRNLGFDKTSLLTIKLVILRI